MLLLYGILGFLRLYSMELTINCTNLKSWRNSVEANCILLIYFSSQLLVLVILWNLFTHSCGCSIKVPWRKYEDNKWAKETGTKGGLQSGSELLDMVWEPEERRKAGKWKPVPSLQCSRWEYPAQGLRTCVIMVFEEGGTDKLRRMGFVKDRKSVV